MATKLVKREANITVQAEVPHSNVIITENLDSEFRRVREDLNHRTSANVSNLPNNIQNQMKKRAQSGAMTSSVFSTFHSPFRIRPSLEAPTKRKDLNEWYRYYYKHDPYVGTAIDLHAEFPISRFGIEHDDPEVAEFFNDIIEELNLHEFLIHLGKEWHVVGEAFPWGFFDDVENPTTWTHFILLDPDKIKINAHRLAEAYDKRGYSIKLEPDADLITIVDRGPNDPNTGPLYHAIPSDIIELVRKRQDIPLPKLQVSHFKRGANYFNVRGESIISRILQDLMMTDKLRDATWCLNPETEVLTDKGFIPIPEVQLWDKVATFNKETEEIEYHCPKKCLSFDYEGNMHHFQTKIIDFMCTPNHRMLVRGNSTNKDWKVVEAKDVKNTYRMRTNGIWNGKEPNKYIEIYDGLFWDVEDYLEFAGYYISEGYASKSKINAKVVAITQSLESKHYDKMKKCCDRLPTNFSHYISHNTKNRFGTSTSTTMRIKGGNNNKFYYEHFKSNFGDSSYNKRMPNWIKELKKEYLEIILNALIAGDGSIRRNRKNKIPFAIYKTVSKKLADDVMDIVWKCGYNPRLSQSTTSISGNKIYAISFSFSKKSHHPCLNVNGGKHVKIFPYKGKVYCLEVPNGFFVTRHNGKISIHGNSIYDRHISPKEFYFIGEKDNPADQGEIDAFRDLLALQHTMPNQAFVWHHAVRIEWIGAVGKTLPMGPEHQLLEKRILIGLGINEGVLTGTGPTYSATSIALDVMIARYMLYREKLEQWLIHSVFKPLCKIHGIYKTKHSEVTHKFKIKKKYRKPDLPRIVWDKPQLRDEMVKIMLYERLVQSGLLGRESLYKLLNMSPEQVREELKDQMKQDTEDRQYAAQQMGAGMPGPGAAGGALPSLGGMGLPMGGGLGMPGMGLPAGIVPPAGATPPGSPAGTPLGGITSPLQGGPMTPPAARRPPGLTS